MNVDMDVSKIEVTYNLERNTAYLNCTDQSGIEINLKLDRESAEDLKNQLKSMFREKSSKL